jgi:hypothetical protein
VCPVRLAYQPPASSTFLSQQISRQQTDSGTFLSEQTNTSHQPNEHACGYYTPLSAQSNCTVIKL